jgi:hypothetical protein
MAKILIAGLESYRGTNRQVDQLLRRKADLVKIVDAYTGDGNFKVQIDKDPRRLKLTARATGKSLSEVVPAGLLLPGAALAVFGLSEQKSATMAMPPPPPPRPMRPARPAPAPRTR